MQIVTVIPLAKGIFREDLTYFTAKEIEPGNLVSVLVRNRKILALVTSVELVSESKGNIKEFDFSLRKIIEVKEKSIFLKEYLETCFAIAQYFNIKKNRVLASFLPNIFIENYDKITHLVKEPNSPIPREGNKIKENKNIKSEKLVLQTNFEDRVSYYKTLIRGSFAQKKSVFLALPTENDINIFYEKLSKGIENYTVILHGNLTASQQLIALEKTLNLSHPVLVFGTVPYLSIPRGDFETIILEHESSNAYKAILSPHIDFRTFVEIYAVKIGSKLILGDTLLRYETIARKESGNLNEVRPFSYRINFEGKIILIDKNKETAEERFSLLNPATIQAIKESLVKKENVFLFSLRKGLATMTLCRDCGTTVMCSNCSAPVVLYLSKNDKKRMFVCNKCGTTKDPTTRCEYCSSWNLVPFGIGTDILYEEIKKIFPKTNIWQLDKEIAQNSKGAEKIVNGFTKNKGGILIGTEMATLYLKEKVPLTVIVSFDGLWSIPNFRMGERIVQLLIAILVKTDKKLIIQTKNTQDETIQAIIEENILNLIRKELQDRKNLEYPPYQRFIKISYLGNKEKTIYAKQLLTEIFEEYHPIIFSGFITRQKDRYVTNALIKIKPDSWSLPELTESGKINEDLVKRLNLLTPDFSIFIDPEDLL